MAKEVRAEAHERLLNVHEAGAMLGLRASTMYQLAYERRLPTVKLWGKHGALRFRESDLRALITRSVRPALRSADEPGGLDL